MSRGREILARDSRSARIAGDISTQFNVGLPPKIIYQRLLLFTISYFTAAVYNLYIKFDNIIEFII